MAEMRWNQFWSNFAWQSPPNLSREWLVFNGIWIPNVPVRLSMGQLSCDALLNSNAANALKQLRCSYHLRLVTLSFHISARYQSSLKTWVVLQWMHEQASEEIHTEGQERKRLGWDHIQTPIYPDRTPNLSRLSHQQSRSLLCCPLVL